MVMIIELREVGRVILGREEYFRYNRCLGGDDDNNLFIMEFRFIKKRDIGVGR